MVHATANLVSPGLPKRVVCTKGIVRKESCRYFFSVSCALFLFAVTGNMDSDSTQNPTFPCGKCSSPVTDLQCDTCNVWFHVPCHRVGNMLYEYLSNSNCSWHCI